MAEILAIVRPRAVVVGSARQSSVAALGLVRPRAVVAWGARQASPVAYLGRVSTVVEGMDVGLEDLVITESGDVLTTEAGGELTTES